MSWAHHDFNYANKPHLTYIAAAEHKQIRGSWRFQNKDDFNTVAFSVADIEILRSVFSKSTKVNEMDL